MVKFSKALVTMAFFVPAIASADHWSDKVLASLDIKETAFCNVLDTYTLQMQQAFESKNQIKVIKVYQDQINDIKALMPTGEFENWIIEVESVEVDTAFNATLRGTLPCHKNILGVQISPSQSIPYSQLSDVSAGEYVLVSGRLSFDENLQNLNPQDFGADFTNIVGMN
ncbi:hypothetical protein N9490_03030 [Planktomarina temperata]|nr:hypothetical protein [Planktomarina temperata]